VSLDDFHGSGSRNTLRNVLFSWPLAEVRAFFEDDLRIPLKVEATGKVFPRSDRSKDVVDALLRALRESGAVLRAPFRVAAVEHRADGGFSVRSSDGKTLGADRLVLATGGLSLPKTGSDGAGLALAAKLGHARVPAYPALVPLLAADAGWSALSGVSVRARVRVEREGRLAEEREGDLLFTHRGFSGPVVLDASHHVTRPPGDAVLRVNWGAVDDWDAVLRAPGRATVGSALRRRLPERLAARLAELAGSAPAQPLAGLRREERARLVDVLARYPLPVRGDEGWATAEVTGGGIPLAEIVPATLESRIVPGLHLAGEMLDATGRLGGYNFLWAWVTGRVVGRALARVRAGPARPV